MEGVFREGRSLEETPTWSVATVTTVMVFVCLFVERSIYRCGRWLKKTRRKALFASVEKIKEELMLLGLISLLLGQCARQISQICVNSSLFSSKFYLCSQEDYGSASETIHLSRSSILSNDTDIPPKGIYQPSHQCGEGREPFVSYEGLEQLHRFLFVLGITHILYSCIVVGLAMTKVEFPYQDFLSQGGNTRRLVSINTNSSVFYASSHNSALLKNKEMRRQSTFALHHASHPWSRSRILIWMSSSETSLFGFDLEDPQLLEVKNLKTHQANKLSIYVMLDTLRRWKAARAEATVHFGEPMSKFGYGTMSSDKETPNHMGGVTLEPIMEVTRSLSRDLRHVLNSKPYKVQWYDDSGLIEVTKQVVISFKVDKYQYEVQCDVMPLRECYVLLGRPWKDGSITPSVVEVHEQTLPKENPRRFPYDHMLEGLTGFLSKNSNFKKSNEELTQGSRIDKLSCVENFPKKQMSSHVEHQEVDTSQTIIALDDVLGGQHKDSSFGHLEDTRACNESSFWALNGAMPRVEGCLGACLDETP
ncbi:MLO-like protein 4 [Capsicum annuum]|nr:MLO-like protein 4 [Capsicum annuum]